jgi:hypothetical protein
MTNIPSFLLSVFEKKRGEEMKKMKKSKKKKESKKTRKKIRKRKGEPLAGHSITAAAPCAKFS